MKDEVLFRTWSRLRPRPPSREVKASFLGRKMVAFREVLLNVLAKPVICAAHIPSLFFPELQRY